MATCRRRAMPEGSPLWMPAFSGSVPILNGSQRGCSLCWTDCPDVFDEDDKDGWSRIVEKFRVAGDLGREEVPESFRKAAQAVSDDCPVSIIQVQ